MDDNSLMPFGKFKGRKLANVPAQYLIFCLEQGWLKGELLNYVNDNKDVLLVEIKRENEKKEKYTQRYIDRNIIPKSIPDNY